MRVGQAQAHNKEVRRCSHLCQSWPHTLGRSFTRRDGLCGSVSPATISKHQGDHHVACVWLVKEGVGVILPGGSKRLEASGEDFRIIARL